MQGLLTLLTFLSPFITTQNLIYTYTVKKFPSRHVIAVSGNCISNRNAGSNFYQM